MQISGHTWLVIGILAVVAVLMLVSSFIGRKHDEWKNSVRILLGVGAFVGLWRLIIASGNSWVVVGTLVPLCAVLFLASLCKSMGVGLKGLCRQLFTSKSTI
jgi:hypothetical protein